MYSYPDYDSFYSEPSEFEMQIDEFKNALKQSVTQEWIDKMNALENENTELQEVKKNFETIKSDYENKKRECELEKERVIREAESTARRARLRELMQDVQVSFWDLSSVGMYGAKCDKCNENRQISYTTPSGKEAFEDCMCAERIYIMQPRLQILYEISLRDRNNKTVHAWFQEHRGDDDNWYSNSNYLGEKIIVEEYTNFEALNMDDVRKFYFRTEERCQEFCDWYNSKIKGIDINNLTDDRGKPVRSSHRKRQ